MTDRLASALMVAIRVHAGQVDKQGEHYLLHVLRVVEAVSDEAKVVAALHDVWEDGGSDGQLDRYVLLARSEWMALKLLTRPESMAYRDYIESIAEGRNTTPAARRIAREVKLADLADNLSRIPEWVDAIDSGMEAKTTNWESMRRRYTRAIKVLSEATP